MILEQRKKGIGGSDVAPILGLSPWKTAYQVWEEKTGLSAGQPDNPAMAYGRLMEPAIRQHYSDVTGRVVVVPSSVIVHPKHDFVLGSLDGIADGNRVLEIKTTRSGEGWGEPGTDEIPVHYATQIQQYLMVTGFAVADVVVSVSGTMPEIYEVPADAELQAMILEEELKFWELVLKKEPPEPVTFADMISRFGKRSSTGSVTASPDALAAFVQLKTLKADMKAMESREEELKAIIMGELGEFDTLLGGNGKTICTWKLSKPSNRFDSKLFETDHPELYAQYLKQGEPQRRMLLK